MTSGDEALVQLGAKLVGVVIDEVSALIHASAAHSAEEKAAMIAALKVKLDEKAAAVAAVKFRDLPENPAG